MNAANPTTTRILLLVRPQTREKTAATFFIVRLTSSVMVLDSQSFLGGILSRCALRTGNRDVYRFVRLLIPSFSAHRSRRV